MAAALGNDCDIVPFFMCLPSADQNEEPVDIAWNSSDSNLSDDETQGQRQSRATALQQQRRPHRSRRSTAPIQSYSRELHTLIADKGCLSRSFCYTCTMA